MYWEIDDRLIYGGITWLVNDLANEDDAGWYIAILVGIESKKDN